MTSKRTSQDELRKLDDAIDESILAASSEELREELAAMGIDPASVVSEMDAVTAHAKSVAAKKSLEQARQAVLAFKAQSAKSFPEDRDASRRKLEAMRAGELTGAFDMMAARKAKGLSDSDEQGMLDDLAQLAALEAEDPQEEE
ncbi:MULTISPECIES: hypothetical protein [Bradyrhizobium]|uniref:Uncharacterized protein n=1 Tax=Bradyrhizobium arachidis TaxID=858423 RepID=A0AAE7NJ02_9BRAD|nr:hypothetical protein [Bradyrhizobium arachidis]QOZ66381.1 hypothetical protein WN72_08170 [Bradyrhizobium arachidis]SFV18330.1 hypothetical protein SAMN05192541_13447 [Bradyrhizobium arachidis]